MTYSSDFRRKVLSVREKEGLTIAQVATRFCVGVASVTRWIKTPDPKLTRHKPATKIDMDALAHDVLDYPDAYQYERARRLGSAKKALDMLCDAWGFLIKKSEASEGRRRRTALLPGTHRVV
ncbi:MAG: IS630 transposase-related protein [Alphaproteobacteria bacterium]